MINSKKLMNLVLIFTIPFFLINFLSFKFALSDEAYFDLSQDKIQIETDFNGKEIIIFGILDPKNETIISVKGPSIDTKISKKERFFGFWFNSKKIIYKKLPSIFFIASSLPINEILNSDSIFKENLYFDKLLVNIVKQRNFIQQKNIKDWDKNLIRIKMSENLYKKYELENVDNKLFQTRVFFPSNSIPGEYTVTIYQVRDMVIKNKKTKIIKINRSGIGNKIFKYAQEQPGIYGLLVIILAIFSGLIAATAFRRL